MTKKYSTPLDSQKICSIILLVWIVFTTARAAPAQIKLSKTIQAGTDSELVLTFGELRCSAASSRTGQLCTVRADCPGGDCVRNPFTPTLVFHRMDVVGCGSTACALIAQSQTAPASSIVTISIPGSAMRVVQQQDIQSTMISLRWTYSGGTGFANATFDIERQPFALPTPVPTP